MEKTACKQAGSSAFSRAAADRPFTKRAPGKLSIGQPNDRYEQEADRVADQVMRMPERGVQRACSYFPVITPLIQRQADEGSVSSSTSDKQLDQIDSRIENIEDRANDLARRIKIAQNNISELSSDILSAGAQGILRIAEKKVQKFNPNQPGKTLDIIFEETRDILVDLSDVLLSDGGSSTFEGVNKLISDLQYKYAERIESESKVFMQDKTRKKAFKLIKVLEVYQFLGGDYTENAAIDEAIEMYGPQRIKPVQSEIQQKTEEEEQEIQTKHNPGGNPPGGSSLDKRLNQSKGQGFNLPVNTRSFMESRFGLDFSGVRIHNDANSFQLNRQLNAQAFTSGKDIYFNRGRYNPETLKGKRLLGHELTHVVQQSGQKKMLQKAPEEVNIPDQGRICKAKREYKIINKPTPTGAKFGIDPSNITFRVNWCKGSNLGKVKFGANIPKQARKVIEDIIGIIRSGGGSNQIEEKLRNTDLTTFVDVFIKQGGSFTITAHGEITVDSSGVSGGKGSIDLNLGPLIISPNIEAAKGSGFKTGVDVKIPFPGKKIDKVKCETHEVKIGKELICTCPTPASKGTFKVDSPFPPRTFYIYFEYNSSNINQKYSRTSIEEIKKILRKGYRVEQISGFTSPEGTFQASPGFEGNDNLAKRRATEAQKYISGLCSLFNTRESIPCDLNVLKDFKQIGKGELLSSDEKGKLLLDDKGKELAGKDLAKETARQFEGSQKEQKHLGVLAEKERKKLAEARNAEEKSRIIYPLLRRVEIKFVKSGMHKIPIELTFPPGKEPCPPHIFKQAKLKLPQKII